MTPDIQPILLPVSNHLGRDAFGPSARGNDEIQYGLLKLTPEVAAEMLGLAEQAQTLSENDPAQQGRGWAGGFLSIPEASCWGTLPREHQELVLWKGQLVTFPGMEPIDEEPTALERSLPQAERQARAKLFPVEAMKKLAQQGLLEQRTEVPVEAVVDGGQIVHFEFSYKELNIGPLAWATFLQAKLSWQQGRQALETWQALYQRNPEKGREWLQQHRGQLQQRLGQAGMETLLGHPDEQIRRIGLRESGQIESATPPARPPRR